MSAARDRLSVLHVVAPGAFGGAESVVRVLTAGLADRGHDVQLVVILGTAGDEPHWVGEHRASGVRCTIVRTPHRGYLRERRALIDCILGANPDIAHTHGYRADVIGGLAALAAGVPVISTAHGLTDGDRKHRLYQWLQLRAYRRFDAVIAVSRALATLLEGAVATRVPVYTVPNARGRLGTLLSREDSRSTLSLSPSPFVVGWVGRVSPEKGADVLVDAATRLSDCEIEFCFVGDGVQRPALEALTKARGINARWVGPVRDAWRVFRAFDLFVLSSRSEGTPMALLEAMDAGVPVVATAVGGVPAVVDDRSAWLVPPENVEALAAAIRNALGDPTARETRSRVARQTLSERFALEPWLREHERLYRQITGRAEPFTP